LDRHSEAGGSDCNVPINGFDEALHLVEALHFDTLQVSHILATGCSWNGRLPKLWVRQTVAGFEDGRMGYC